MLTVPAVLKVVKPDDCSVRPVPINRIPVLPPPDGPFSTAAYLWNILASQAASCPGRLAGSGVRFDSPYVHTQPSRKAPPDYSPTRVRISARNISRCAAAQASSRGNK